MMMFLICSGVGRWGDLYSPQEGYLMIAWIMSNCVSRSGPPAYSINPVWNKKPITSYPLRILSPSSNPSLFLACDLASDWRELFTVEKKDCE